MEKRQTKKSRSCRHHTEKRNHAITATHPARIDQARGHRSWLWFCPQFLSRFLFGGHPRSLFGGYPRFLSRFSHRYRHPCAIAIILAGVLFGCTTIPATGTRDFTLLQLTDDIELGEKVRDEILRSNTLYEDKELNDYINSITQFLVQTSELPHIPFHISIIDSPVPNAMALPGGYLFINRGLLAYIDNEAQLAAVISHEIGHVTARHTARQIGRRSILQFLLSMLGTATESRAVSNIAGQGAQLYMLKHSRDSEYEADDLSIRYLGRAGFDTRAMADFLRKLHAHARLQQKIHGADHARDQSDFLSTHPSSPKRIKRSDDRARAKGTQHNPIVGTNVYLQKINGLIYGKNTEKQGFIENKQFIHPELGLRFRVPDDYNLRNESAFVLATATADRRVLVDIDTPHKTKNPAEYIARIWSSGTPKDKIVSFHVNQRPAAMALGQGTTKNGNKIHAALIAIEWRKDLILRFTMTAQDPVQGEKDRASILASIADVSSDIHRPGQRYIDVIKVTKTAPLSAFVNAMAFDSLRLERLATLNGREDDSIVQKGELLKVIRLGSITKKPPANAVIGKGPIDKNTRTAHHHTAHDGPYDGPHHTPHDGPQDGPQDEIVHGIVHGIIHGTAAYDDVAHNHAVHNPAAPDIAHDIVHDIVHNHAAPDIAHDTVHDIVHNHAAPGIVHDIVHDKEHP